MNTNPKIMVRIGTLLLGLMLVASSPALAETLAAGPLVVPYDPDNTNAIDCSIANIGKSPITVTITAQFVDGGSNVGEDFVLLPGEVDGVGLADNSETEPVLGYCRFELTGRPSSVRATACVLDEYNTCQSAVRAY